MVYAKKMRLILRGLRQGVNDGRHGIWHMAVFSQQQTVMLLQKKDDDFPKCLVRAESQYNFSNKPMVLMNCYEAVMQNDAREIFFLDQLLIKQWADNMCIAPQAALGNNAQFVVTQKCQDNEEQQWVIDRLGKVASRKYTNKCLAASDDPKISQVQGYGQVSVSNTIGDSRANPYNVVDPNGYGWWAPPIDVSHAWIQISFDRPYICEKIMIKWKLKPPKYELQIMGQDQKWVTQKFEAPSDDVELELSPQELLGVKILLLNLDERGGVAEVPIYGIRKI